MTSLHIEAIKSEFNLFQIFSLNTKSRRGAYPAYFKDINKINNIRDRTFSTASDVIKAIRRDLHHGEISPYRHHQKS